LEFNKSRGKIVLRAAMQSEFKFDAGGYRCVAVRSDRHWGHGLDVNILGRDGHLLNVVTFACNPELPSFKTFQALSTQELVELAANQLNSGELESSLSEAREAKLQLFVSFEITAK
jgi:hypothetical protein